MFLRRVDQLLPSQTMIIGIAGDIGSGKNTVANILSTSFGYKVLECSDKLKQVVSFLYKLPLPYWNNRHWRNCPLKELGGKTPNQVLPIIADGFRKANPDTFVNALIEEIIDYSLVTIPGIRYPNEVVKLKEHDNTFKLIYIHTPSNKSIQTDTRDLSHESESYSQYMKDNADVCFLNTGTVHDLQATVRDYMRSIRTF